MTKGLFIWALVYLVGYFFSFSMLRIEHEAEGKPYTKGDRVLSLTLSLLSFGMVLLMLVSTWFKTIAKTGYWNKPVKAKPE